jgi:delta24-sterol reductase
MLSRKIQTVTSDSELGCVDGILFSKSKGAIITGRMTDIPLRDVAIQRFSNANNP